MTEVPFLSRLRAAIQQNGGTPPGENRFYADSGLSRSDLWAAGYENYGAACKAAGSQPNPLQPRLTDEQLFRPLAVLVRARGAFPSKGAMEVQRKRDPAFPSWEAFKRRERQGPEATLRAALAGWCRSNPEFEDILPLLETGAPVLRSDRTKEVVNGHVYLMRYGSSGSVFKIGRTENLQRRHAQLNSMAPQDVRVIHSIPTDDPRGIEAYWLARFQPKLVQGKNELFRLSSDDIVAFKSRRYQ